MSRVPLTRKGDRVVAVGAAPEPPKQGPRCACGVNGDLVAALRRVEGWLDSEPALEGRLIEHEKSQMRALVLDALAKAQANRAFS